MLIKTDQIEFDYIDFVTSGDVGEPQEGRMHWNSEDGTLDIGMPGGDVTLSLGQEMYLPDRPKNVQGTQINNGQAVYISGATGAVPQVELANAAETTGSKVIAIATEDIVDNQRGYYTTYGVVRDIDTSFGSEGDEIFLDDTDGGLTTDKLSHPNFRVKIGTILRAHATEGVIFVNISGDQWLKRFQAMGDPTGFDRNNSDLMGDIAFVDGTRTFTISVKSGQDYFTHWIRGREYRHTSSDSIVITDVEGVHVIYYADGTLTEMVSPSTTQMTDLIKDKALISIVYWDVSEVESIYFGEERHGINMPGSVHSRLHWLDGCRYDAGLGLNTLSTDGTGILVDAQFGIDSGGVYDEDIFVHISTVTSTTGLPVYHIIGASDWTRTVNSGYSARTQDDTSATNIAYNQYTGGAWQLTAVGNNDYVLYHIFATTDISNPMIAIMGQDEYATIISARAGALTEIKSIIKDNTLTPEIKAIATIIYQANSAYTNDINARIRTTADGDNYIDWREEAISRTTSSTSDHNDLTGLQGGTSGEYYHLNNEENTAVTDFVDGNIYGEKVFDHFPTIPVILIDDWFLPSRDELAAMESQLAVHSVGNFVSDVYMSSSESGIATIWAQHFGTSVQSQPNKGASLYVRAIRSFTDTTTSYSVRDTGPSGGLIFYVSGDNYLEAAPADETTTLTWSDITNVTIGTTGTAVGTGQDNTDDILAQSATAPAPLACDTKSLADPAGPIPTADDELANKKYVDDSIISIFDNLYRNAIINGNMDISQEKGTTLTSLSSSNYILDMFQYTKNGTMAHSGQQSTDIPTGGSSQYSLLLDCTTADTSIAAGDYATVRTNIEGYNFYPYKGKTATLSFWVKATKTGTYCISFRNSGVDRSYISEYTVNTSDTWEKKTITLDFDESGGTWDYTNGIGVRITWSISMGSTYQTTADTWQTGNYLTTSNQVNGCDSTSNNFRLYQVQLNMGDTTLDFEYESYSSNLAKCQRYLLVPFLSSGKQYGLAGGFHDLINIAYPVRLRVNPTITILSGSPSYVNCTHHRYVAYKDFFTHQVTVTANGEYYESSGITFKINSQF